MQIDKVMIKELLGGYEVGLYTAGVKFPEAVGFLPMFLATSLFPAILNSRNNSEKLYRQRLQKFYFSMTWIAIALVVFFVMVSDVLVGFYGYQYLAANDVLIVYSISLIFLFQWIARGRWVLAENLQSLTFYYMAVGAAINIMLNLVLIKKYGVVGAAWATVITQFFITLIIPLFFDKMRDSTLMLYKSYITWKI